MEEKITQSVLEAKQCIGRGHEGLIVTSADGTIVDVSPAGERILESLSTTLKGRAIRDICQIPASYDELTRQANSEGRNLNKSVILLTGSNKKKIVNMSVQRIGEGAMQRYVHVFQDC